MYKNALLLLAALAVCAQMYSMHMAIQTQAAKLVELEAFTADLTDTIMQMQDDAPSEF